VNLDPHSGWKAVPAILFVAALIVAFVVNYFSRKPRQTHAVPSPSGVPRLKTLVIALALAQMAAKGLVIVSDRVTHSSPHLFPLAYLGILAALVAPLWIWNPDGGVNFTRSGTVLAILYVIPLTFLVTMGYGSAPRHLLLASHLWSLAVLIAVAYLLFLWNFKKESQPWVVIAGGLLFSFTVLLVFVDGWITVTSWVATWVR
jgi:hypothetical protein